MQRVDFVAPVRLGDTVTFYTTTTRTGTKSVTVRVDVESERYDSGNVRSVTTAELTMVSVDAEGNPIPFASEATVTVDR